VLQLNMLNAVRRRAEQVSPRGGVEPVLLETPVLDSDLLLMRRVAATTPMMELEVVIVVHHVQALDSGRSTQGDVNEMTLASSRLRFFLSR
jgi:hypothetical protein